MKKILIGLAMFLSFGGYAQESSKGDSTGNPGLIEKLFDFADNTINLISGEKWSFIPAVVYSPETSLGFGARAIRVFRHKNIADSLLRPSTLPITFLYTFNNQTFLTTELDLWANKNREHMNVRLELSNYPFKFYGIGNELDASNEEFYSTRFFYFHVDYEWQISKGLYIGPRYEFRTDNIYKKKPDGILDSDQVAGSDGQRISGLGLVLNQDTRDNIFQPHKGWYNQYSWMTFQPFLGSNFTFNQYRLDFRRYLNLHKKQVLALQSWWSFTAGNPPFQHVSLIGGSQLMRGYFEGRYRDKHAMVHQAEYRVPIFRNFGMVFFGSAGQVAHQVNSFGWDRFRYGGGLGFRYRLNQEGLNIRMDIAFGDQKAFYFGLNEVF
ncbi:BamA/TamA family outer membrane protein [Rhodonellum sp.]|uniref:BamA/TamA family outer membrane protein n=1 Tax=Rhodonellum sp. TaxID=2231180 RepID=UPI0027284CDB|nr:BamA/TamA family outer membrane protein [Rhodonellum sp.]MDO9552550.1 BamA/TamA family outer membrane protein [Rhodonellum sp.]